MAMAEICGWTYTVTGLLTTPPTLAVRVAVPEPVGGVQMVKSGTPPGLRRFHVPPQTAPVGLISARLRLELP